jgi:hypothetical protein
MDALFFAPPLPDTGLLVGTQPDGDLRDQIVRIESDIEQFGGCRK